MSRIDYVTPTQLAEEAYAAAQRRKQPVGPAGLPIPAASAIYSKPLDGKLLGKIAQVAFAAYKVRELTPEREAEAAQILRADLVGRYPQSDMTTLERYGLAERWDGPWVQLIVSPVDEGVSVRFAEPVLLPRRLDRTGAVDHHAFHVDLGGTESSRAAPVPTAAVPYFRSVHAVRTAWRRAFEPAYQWCGLFRVEKERWPRWHEIERQFPRIGEWLEEQRASIKRPQEIAA